MGLIAAILLAATATAVLLWKRAALRGTTLLGGWWWLLAAVVAPLLGEVFVHFGPWEARSGWTEPFRFCLAMLVFCPVMAVLGAKRPHHRAWQFIVASLWVVLILPAAEKFFLQGGQAMQMTETRKWFLVVLIFVTSSNYLITRFWLSSLLWSAASIAFCGPYLPMVSWQLEPGTWQLGGIMFGALAVVAVLPVRTPSLALSWDARWLCFRDAFGTLWGLRIVERMQALAEQYQWSFRLTWWGWHDTEGAALTEFPSQDVPTVRQSWENLMRRFVDDTWLPSESEASDRV